MNTNMTGFRWFSKHLSVLVLWTNVASALEGLKWPGRQATIKAVGLLYYLSAKHLAHCGKSGEKAWNHAESDHS